VAAADEKRALATELQSLRDYCTGLWLKGEHAAAAAGVEQILGGSGGGGGGAAFHKMHVRTGAAFLTVELCQKALVLLRPTALTAERVILAQHVQVLERAVAGGSWAV